MTCIRRSCPLTRTARIAFAVQDAALADANNDFSTAGIFAISAFARTASVETNEAVVTPPPAEIARPKSVEPPPANYARPLRKTLSLVASLQFDAADTELKKLAAGGDGK